MRTAAIFLLPALLLLPGTALAVELVSIDFSSRPGEFRTVVQVSDETFAYTEQTPSPGKLLVEITGMCHSYGSPEEKRALDIKGVETCPSGTPHDAVRPLYRFDATQPLRTINVVDMGRGKVEVIFRMRNPGLPHQVDRIGDQLVVVIGPGADPAGRPAQAASGAGTRMPATATGLPASRPATSVPADIREAMRKAGMPEDTQLPPGTRSTPIGKADTKLGPPDPRYLPQSSEYRLGAGDVVKITVHADERLDRTLPVDTSGYINMTLLGALPVAGRMVSEVEAELERMLSEYLRDPDVTVLVEEYNSQYVNVLGEVNEAAKVPLKGRTTLLDILSEVGGVTDKASGLIVVHRRGETESKRFMLDDIITGEPGSNMLMQNGDMVNVAAKQYFYVSGEVKSPGKYEVEPGMTVIDALAVAGGITEYGQKDKAFLVRSSGEQRDRIQFNPKGIEKGKEKNIEVLPRDHIKIPPKYF